MVSEIRVGHVLDELAKMAPESVSCCVTSPPYWSLRKYDAPDAIWGGDPACVHEWQEAEAAAEAYVGTGRWQHDGVSREETPEAWSSHQKQGATSQRKGRANIEAQRNDNLINHGGTCSLCGAWRGQLGLEPTPDLFVEHTMEWLRAVRRVLRKDGVAWINIGDSYAGGGRGERPEDSSKQATNVGSLNIPHTRGIAGLKPKDLILMPQRIAIAAQADGWWVRSMIVWSKPNAMPESCQDRPSSAHETIIMLTKQSRYWYDQEAVREAHTTPNGMGWASQTATQDSMKTDGDFTRPKDRKGLGMLSMATNPAGRNLRDVWTFPTAQTPEAHFATFPEELPRRCIEASCPREACRTCGKARVRIVERQGLEEHPARKDRSVRNKADYDGEDYAERDSTLGLVANDVTTGWTSCECADYQPGLVLDPFAGIGTTGVVAKRLGRRFVGIELSKPYAAMAQQKLDQYWRKVILKEPERDERQMALL